MKGKSRRAAKKGQFGKRDKNKKKVDWLLKKYRKEEEDICFTVPKDVDDFKNVDVFYPRFETPVSVTDYSADVTIIGDIQPPLDEEEKAVLPHVWLCTN